MSTMQAEVFEAFRSIGVPEDKALTAASALSRRDADVTSLKADLAALDDRVALKADLMTLAGRVRVIEWMLGFVLAFQVAILVKLFVH